jgi:hypothetical protein
MSKIKGDVRILVGSDFMRSTPSVTLGEREMLEAVKHWSILEKTGEIIESSYEEIFEKFGFETSMYQ